MKWFLLTLIGLSLALVAYAKTPATKVAGRGLAQDSSVKVSSGGYLFKVYLDPKDSRDHLEVTKPTGEKLCTYVSKKETDERFYQISVDHNPIPFSNAENRYFVTEWSLPSNVATDDFKILDVSKTGGECSFVAEFIGIKVVYTFDHDALKIRALVSKDTQGENLVDQTTSCVVGDQGLSCGTVSEKAIP